MLAKSASMTWRSEWTPRLEIFSENALWAASSQNLKEKMAESEDKEASEWRGFQAGVDLFLGAIDMTNINTQRERERERESEKSQAIQI